MKRIVCMGGGPAGLYSAILFKKALPGASVEIFERNRPARPGLLIGYAGLSVTQLKTAVELFARCLGVGM